VVYAGKAAPDTPNIGQQGLLATVLGLGLLGMLVLMFSGGIAAMGNTMFPSESLGQGLAADFDPNSHPLIRLRILHPLIAITVGIYLFLSLGLGWWLKPVAEAKKLAQMLFAVYMTQLVVGTVNLAFLAPTVLQLLHLALAVVSFCLLTLMSAYALGVSVQPRAVFQPLKEI
jgi:heme A synthase